MATSQEQQARTEGTRLYKKFYGGVQKSTGYIALFFIIISVVLPIYWAAISDEDPSKTETSTTEGVQTSKERTVDILPGQGKDLTVGSGETVRVNNLAQHHLQWSQMSGCIIFRLNGEGDFRLNCPRDQELLPAFRFVEFRTPEEEEVSLRVFLDRLQ